MKTILIVEDTQVNLETAKAFFSTIPGFKFVYATNRKEAAALLPAVDAVITDRSMRYSEDSLLGCEVDPSKGDHPRYKNQNAYLDQINGYWIMYKAHLLGKPTVMMSEHGSLYLILPKIAEMLSEVQSWEMTEDYKLDFSLEKLLEDLEKDPQIEFCNYMFDYSCERIADARKEKNMKKTDRESWKMVWEELQKQF